MKLRLLLRPVRYFSVGLILVCACSVQLSALILGVGQQSRLYQDQTFRLLVTDNREGVSAEPLRDVIRRVAGSPNIAVQALSTQEIMRAAGIPASQSTMPLPKMAEILVPPSIPAEAALARLRSKPELLVQVLSKSDGGPTHSVSIGRLLILVALATMGWSAHEHIRRRAPLLGLLRQIGCSPNRLVGEALAPIAASAVVGVASAMLLTAIFVGSVLRPAGAAMFTIFLLALGSALLGGLGSLRRMMATLP